MLSLLPIILPFFLGVHSAAEATHFRVHGTTPVSTVHDDVRSSCARTFPEVTSAGIVIYSCVCWRETYVYDITV